MERNLLASLVLGISMLFAACDRNDQVVHEYKVDNIVRIFMHEPSHYTFLVQDPNSTLIQRKWIKMKPGNITLLADVPAGKHSLLLIGKDADGRIRKVELHLHNVAAIGAAGWRTQAGKEMRTGQTHVVE